MSWSALVMPGPISNVHAATAATIDLVIGSNRLQSEARALTPVLPADATCEVIPPGHGDGPGSAAGSRARFGS